MIGFETSVFTWGGNANTDVVWSGPGAEQLSGLGEGGGNSSHPHQPSPLRQAPPHQPSGLEQPGSNAEPLTKIQ